jgi:hypothetical protein
MFQAQPMGRFACQLRPRFDVACQNSSAAAPQTTAINAGTFITVMFMSGRLPSASEICTTPIRGNGIAASIRDQSRANIRPRPPRPSRRPAPISNSAWQVFLSKRTEAYFQAWRDQRDWTARKYALGDTGKRLEPPAMDRGNCASVPEVSLRRDIRHARPRGGAGACASHFGGRTCLKRKPSRVPSSLRLRVVASHHHAPSLSSRVAR